MGVMIAPFVGGLVTAALLLKLAGLSAELPSRLPTKPCVDIFSGPSQPAVYSIDQLYQSNYGRAGLAHITVAGAWHHGMRRVEVWLQTFAPGSGTPIHRHDCEEVFVIQRGAGTAFFRARDGSMQQAAFRQNDTLVIPPNLVHRFVNTGQEDLQALVVFSNPPIDIYSYPNWSVVDREAVRQEPYYWDRSPCPPTLPEALQVLQQQTGHQSEL